MKLTQRFLVVGLAASMLSVAVCFAADGADEVIRVVIPGDALVVNDQAEVPRGLFGVHAFDRLNAETIQEYGIECSRHIHFAPGAGSIALRSDGSIKDPFNLMSVVIDCQGDRYHPATVLTNPDYEKFFTRIGRAYGEACLAAGWPGVVEFWNEPYLNWASRSHGGGRNHYHPKWYDQSSAVDGGKVTIKGWSEPLEHLRWRRFWARGEDDRIYYGVKIPEGLKPGDTFVGASPSNWYFTNRDEQTFTVVEEWGVEDPTQVGFWSGRQNLDFYLWMFVPFARAVKEANPDVKVIGGWDFNPAAGGWNVFSELTVPIIDATIEWLDGIAEHHYGIYTRSMPAWYEVICAYAVSRHGKWLKTYNTECGGELDPALHGLVELDEELRDTARRQAAQATYMLRDIIELAYHSPAKVGSRTTHHPQHNPGMLWALRFLRDLRGSLLAVECDDPDTWTVAALNSNSVVVVIFNNARELRNIEAVITVPGGGGFTAGRIERLVVDPADGALGIESREFFTEGNRRVVSVAEPVQRHEALKVVLAVGGDLLPARTRHQRQYFAREGVLLPVGEAAETAVHVAVPSEHAVGAGRAWLKLVLEGVGEDAPVVTLNGRALDFPARNWTTMHPVDPALIKPENRLVFTAAGKPYQVNVVSIVIETE